jgi:hypothetical protein
MSETSGDADRQNGFTKKKKNGTVCVEFYL